MVDGSNAKSDHQRREGLRSMLPPSWDTAVQLIGTYGLAVFLVLFYVLKMGPENNNRHEVLSATIGDLQNQVEVLALSISDDTIVLPEDKLAPLYNHYFEHVAIELSTDIHSNLRNDDPRTTENEDRLKNLICQRMSHESNWLIPLRFHAPDGTPLYNDCLMRITERDGICRRIAEKAVKSWLDLTSDEIKDEMIWSLRASFLGEQPPQTAEARSVPPTSDSGVAFERGTQSGTDARHKASANTTHGRLK